MNLSIVHSELSSPIDRYYVIPFDAVHYVYVYDSSLKPATDNKINFTIKFESTFENSGTTGTVFATVTQFIFGEDSLGSDATENLHGLLDIAYLKHLRSLEKKLQYTGYSSKIQLRLDTIRFGALINDLIRNHKNYENKPG